MRPNWLMPKSKKDRRLMDLEMQLNYEHIRRAELEIHCKQLEKELMEATSHWHQLAFEKTKLINQLSECELQIAKDVLGSNEV